MIYLACDHAGFTLKKQVITCLKGLSREYKDLGVHEIRSVDYPDLAHKLSRAVADGETDEGILICGTGIGMSMVANRHAGVRAALCHDAFTAEMARRHNNANVLCLGARVIGAGVAEQIVTVFLSTAFEGGRHQQRLDKLAVPEEA